MKNDSNISKNSNFGGNNHIAEKNDVIDREVDYKTTAVLQLGSKDNIILE